MKRIVITLVASGSLAACGSTSGSPANDNAGKVDAARQKVEARAVVLARLTPRLKLHEYAGVQNTWTVPVGGPDVHLGDKGTQCSIQSVYVGDEVADHESQPDVLVAPDRSAAVSVNIFMDSDLALCLSTAKEALGW